MRSEVEIKDKLTYYEGMLSGIKAAGAIDNPDVFLAVSQYFPGEAMALLHLSAEMAESIRKLPPEDRGWFGQLFEMHGHFLQQVLESRVSMLKWVLEGLDAAL